MKLLDSHLFHRILNKLYDRDRKELFKLRDEGKLYLLPELLPYFKGKKVFAFGTGGSIANLTGIERLQDYNLMITTTGPYYMRETYGFVPSIWTATYEPIIERMLNLEANNPIDFSKTFILVPSTDSGSKIHFNSPFFRKFRKRHPEATYVLYRQTHKMLKPEIASVQNFREGLEPLYGMNGSILDNLFLPICLHLGICTVYFSGVDLISTTGHFWNRSLLYQTMNGKPLTFPKKSFVLSCAEAIENICRCRNLTVYRLEKKDTVLQNYPFYDFENALKDASAAIKPKMLRT